MRRPLTFAWHNVVFGQDLDDAWALFRVQTHSYEGLSVADKRDVLGRLAGWAAAAEADFQLIRVHEPWTAEAYVGSVDALRDQQHGRDARLDAVVAQHVSRIGDQRGSRVALFAAVSLNAARGSGGVRQVFDGLGVLGLARALGWRDARGVSMDRLAHHFDAEQRAFDRLAGFLDVERATTLELQWLIRRAFARATDGPELEASWRPQALVLEDEQDGRRVVPLEFDVLRLMDAPIEIEPRSLRVDSEDGVSHQTFVALGALPEVVHFPGRQAELLFAPLEALDFDVDVSVNVRWITNDEAIALARRKVIDADHLYEEESHGDHGPTTSGALRPGAARELEDYLVGPDRPPLLRTTISFAVAASDQQQLDARVERLRREYAPIALHRPLGDQLGLFTAHLPAQRCTVRGYEDVLLCEQLGAMVPTAAHAVGSEAGLYIGHTLVGSGQPVLFDPTEASRVSRPPALLCAGAPGSGKTVCAQLIAYLAFLRGSRVVDVDPKGDHRLDELVGAEHVERIELSGADADRGLLDPLRIGPDDTRADLAYTFLSQLLPAPVPAEWQTELRHAVDVVASRGGRCCTDVLGVLADGPPAACEVARAISIHTRGGLLTLGFARPGQHLRDAGERALTSLRIANLTLPLPGTARSDLTSDERAGQALLRLLATYALRLMAGDAQRHKLLIFDEAWMLLDDAAGHALIARINRLCRSQHATPILATQTLGDIAGLEGLLGAAMCFGVSGDHESRRALQLVGLDADDDRLRARMQGFREGRCFFRDYDGRVEAIRIDPVDPRILAALDTRPVAHADAAA